MAISIAVPKELSGIKTKVVFNLTKRQLVCFGSAVFLGISFYMATKEILGTETSTFVMMVLLFPFFFLAMYEKEGFPAEKWLYFMLRQKFFTQGIRPYQSETIYQLEEEQEPMQKEVKYLEQKARGKTGRVQSKENR